MSTKTAAQTVLDAAIEAGRVEVCPRLAPQLLAGQQRILLAVETHTRRAHETVGSLPFGRIHCLFLYAVCRGYEAAYYWHTGGDYEVSTAGMFTGEVQCNVSDAMIAHVRGIPLADELFGAFTSWAAAIKARRDMNAPHAIGKPNRSYRSHRTYCERSPSARPRRGSAIARPPTWRPFPARACRRAV